MTDFASIYEGLSGLSKNVSEKFSNQITGTCPITMLIRKIKTGVLPIASNFEDHV